MPDYSKGKIYKLWSIDNDLIYVGSTTQTLSKRLSHHKSHKDCTSSILFEKSNNVKIELLESYPCNSKEELNRKEGEMIRKLNCVNKLIAGRTEKEYREDNEEKIKEYKKEYSKKHREANKELISQKKREYYQENKGKFCNKAKEYREKNKEKIAETKKEYREKNKEKINEKVLCTVCDCYITKRSMNRHERTIKHNSKLFGG